MIARIDMASIYTYGEEQIFGNYGVHEMPLWLKKILLTPLIFALWVAMSVGCFIIIALAFIILMVATGVTPESFPDAGRGYIFPVLALLSVGASATLTSILFKDFYTKKE